MAAEKFNLPLMYQRAFGGHVALPLPGMRANIPVVHRSLNEMLGGFSGMYKPAEVDVPPNFYELGAANQSKGFELGNYGLRTSVLGTPIYMPVQMYLASEKDLVNKDSFWLPNEPLLEISGGNEIVKEPKASGKGTFKEFMGLKDYSIVIRGIAVNETDIDDYPEKEVRRLRLLAESGQAVIVRSPLFALFGINQIVIENHRYPATEGLYSAQAYEFQCCSDEDEELELITNPNGNF